MNALTVITYVRTAFNVVSILAVLMLCDCAQSVGSRAVPDGRTIGLPAAQPANVKQQQLFISTYRTNHGWGEILLFGYPSGTYSGSLPAPPEGYNGPAGECRDTSGNVYFANEGALTIDEYTGEGKFVRSLSDGQLAPTACSFSPSTGDLAAVNAIGSSGTPPASISIFRGADGPPKIITSPYFFTITYLSYDRLGNLFFDGSQSQVGTDQYGEIPKGSSMIERVSFNERIYPEQLQFDGEHMAIGSVHGTIYQADGRNIVRAIKLKDGVAPFFIAGDRILTLNGPKKNQYTVQVYKYPEGGAPLQGIKLQYYSRGPTAGDIILSH